MKYTTAKEWMEMFVGRVKIRLEEKGITQRELAAMAGMTEVTLSRILTGARIPRGPAIVRIAEALECPVEYLMGE